MQSKRSIASDGQEDAHNSVAMLILYHLPFALFATICAHKQPSSDCLQACVSMHPQLSLLLKVIRPTSSLLVDQYFPVVESQVELHHQMHIVKKDASSLHLLSHGLE